jgi:hypothetical protein
MARRHDRLLLVDVDGGEPGGARAKRLFERPSATSSARLVFTSSAVRFMRARSSGVTSPCVSGVEPHVQADHVALAKKASRDGATSNPSARAAAVDASRPQTQTFMPNTRPYAATWRPMRP